jgi:hypothetical protein
VGDVPRQNGGDDQVLRRNPAPDLGLLDPGPWAFFRAERTVGKNPKPKCRVAEVLSQHFKRQSCSTFVDGRIPDWDRPLLQCPKQIFVGRPAVDGLLEGLQ